MTRTDNALAFLRMAAIQMRRLAECAPEIAGELRDLVGDLDEEAIQLQNERREYEPAE